MSKKIKCQKTISVSKNFVSKKSPQNFGSEKFDEKKILAQKISDQNEFLVQEKFSVK